MQKVMCTKQGLPNGAQSGAGHILTRCTAGAGRGDSNFVRGGAGRLEFSNKNMLT